jgi:tight adherence protein B
VNHAEPERRRDLLEVALVTSLIVQKESGGNLTEILERINHVIRGRTRFQRRVKTLSAEGRLSAWILTMMPFVLVLILQISSPEYLKPLFEDPDGFKMIGSALGGMLLGVLCMRQIIRIRV